MNTDHEHANSATKLKGAQVLLEDSRSVLDAAFAVGRSGPGSPRDPMVTINVATPDEHRTHGKGVIIHYGIHASPFGECLVGTTDRGICALRFIDEEDPSDAILALGREWSGAQLIRDDAGMCSLVESIFSGRVSGEPLSLLLRGTDFQVAVWRGLLRVPEGALVSYGDLAERLSMPSATRAVASAVGANPVAYIIPCHRVVRSTGALGGYRWGLDRKASMLKRERPIGTS